MVCVSGKKIILHTAILFSALVKSAHSAEILIFILRCTYSQLNVHHPYAVGLVEAGHSVTFVLPTKYKEPDPRIKYIVPDKAHQRWLDMHGVARDLITAREADVKSGGNINNWSKLPVVGADLCEKFFESSGIKEWIQGSKKGFDLVVIDGVYNDCGLGLALKFQAPFIYFETGALFPSTYDTFGVIPENSWIPDVRKRRTGEMNFWERLENVWLTLQLYFEQKQFSGYYVKLAGLFESHLGLENVPPLEDLERNASLVLVNSHFSMEYARSLPPLYVSVGGIQCPGKSRGDLPLDIAQFIKKYTAGFVYSSFGTFAELPPLKQRIFFEAFASFPDVGFVMKWTRIKPTSVPSNVLLVEFAPQQLLLAQKSILGFISHGGLLSVHETIYHGVPMIGLPVFAEQDFNVENLRRLGAAVKAEIGTLTTEELKGALKEIISNPSYRDSVREISKLSKDRPRPPLEEAVWWTEYVLRNAKEGTLEHLKPVGVRQYWFQRRCLDVWGFIGATVLLMLYLGVKFIISLLFLCTRALRSARGKKEKNE